MLTGMLKYYASIFFSKFVDLRYLSQYLSLFLIIFFLPFLIKTLNLFYIDVSIILYKPES